MKIFVQSPDAAGQIDGTVARNLLAHLPNLVRSPGDADCFVIPISWFPNFVFNESLREIKKPTVILDFLEPHSPLPSYDRFSEWAQAINPVLTLRRELRQHEVTDRIQPIEFPCYVDIPPTQTREEFDARPIERFFNWGYSHYSRPQLHAYIFRAMATDGIEVIDSFEELEKRQGDLPKRTWVSIHTHHSVRRPVAEIMKWQQQSKISVSLPGNGWICFRSTEAPVGSIVAHLANDMARSYPWVNGENCVTLDPDNAFFDLENVGRLIDLYPVYVAGQETIRQYAAPRYAREYVLPKIEAALK